MSAVRSADCNASTSPGTPPGMPASRASRATGDGAGLPRRPAAASGRVAEHSLLYSRGLIGFEDFSPEERARLPSSPQRLVRVHPGSGRKTLYLAAHAMRVHGMPVPEGRILLKDLMEHATKPPFLHTHKWRAGERLD